jgi:protein subunit release factor B
MKKNSKENPSKLIFSVTIHDCEVQTFRSGGPGGQHQNKTSSGVRIIHHPSGARGESREERSQLQNKRSAFRRMVESGVFRMWIGKKLVEGTSAEEKVAEEMKPENIRYEIKENNRWIEKTE